LTLPNTLSLARIAAIPLIIYFLLVPGPNYSLIAAAFFALLCLTDLLDGYLARRLDAVSTFGKYIDPLSDKILVISVLLALIETRGVSSIPVMIIAAREFTVTAFRLAAAGENIVIAADWLGKWKTVTQMLAVMFLILSWPYAGIILWIAVLLTLISGLDYIYRSWGKVFGR